VQVGDFCQSAPRSSWQSGQVDRFDKAPAWHDGQHQVKV